LWRCHRHLARVGVVEWSKDGYDYTTHLACRPRRSVSYCTRLSLQVSDQSSGNALSYAILSVLYQNGIATSTQVFKALDNMPTATLALSLGSNASATFLIAYKAWCVCIVPGVIMIWCNRLHCRKHKHAIAAVSVKHYTRTNSERILALLVESGLFYCVIQVGETI
jgi:hypothetical protein